MALTRNYLKSIGVDAEKIDSIIEAHAETVEGLKSRISEIQAEADAYKDAASAKDQLTADLDKANKTISNLREKSEAANGITQERDALKTEVDSLKAQITEFTEKETTANNELTSLREQLATFEADKNTATAEAERVKTEFDAFKTQVETERTNAVKRDAVRNVLRDNGVARSDFQDLIINSLSMDDISMGENGMENADTFIETTKSKYPSCFGTVTEEGTKSVEPMGGNPPRKLTIAQIKAMTADEINANWEAVQKAMASQK